MKADLLPVEEDTRASELSPKSNSLMRGAQGPPAPSPTPTSLPLTHPPNGENAPVRVWVTFGVTGRAADQGLCWAEVTFGPEKTISCPGLAQIHALYFTPVPGTVSLLRVTLHNCLLFLPLATLSLCLKYVLSLRSHVLSMPGLQNEAQICLLHTQASA